MYFFRSMAHLYRDAHWSHGNLDALIREAKEQVTKSKMGIFTIDRVKYYHQQLNQRKQEGYKTTFIDLWGLMIEYLLNEGVQYPIFLIPKNYGYLVI